MLPLAPGNCPAIGYCSLFHIPITKLLENSHFEVRTREVVWAPPLRQVLRLSLERRLGWICKSLKQAAFLNFWYVSSRLDFGANPGNGGFSVKALLWREFSTVWGQGCGSWKEMLESVRHSSSSGKRRLYLLWADCWCGTNPQKDCSWIGSVVFPNKLTSEDQIKSLISPCPKVNCTFQ